jgi:hypothetical protein
VKKIFKLPGVGAVAFCGNPAWTSTALQWLREPDTEIPKCIVDGEICGLVIHDDGEVYVMAEGPPFPIECPYHTMGSGRDIALGALAMGATAEQAVDIAARHDQATAGITQTIKVF